MNGKRLIVEFKDGMITIGDTTIEYSGKVLSFAMIADRIFLIFDWNNFDPRINSGEENMICFHADGTLCWKLDLASMDIKSGPFTGFNYRQTNEVELRLSSIGSPYSPDCVVSTENGKFIRKTSHYEEAS